MTTAAQDWDRARAAVRAAAADLTDLDTAGLRRWATDNDLMTRPMWSKVKRELYKQLDLDYDAMRTAEAAAATSAIGTAAAAAPLIELFAAGDERGSFAVVGPVDDAAWYGTFHKNDRVFRRGDQDSADDSAAGKAIFLAGKAREDAALDAVRLLLHLSNPGVDGAALAGVAATHRVALDLDITDVNRAERWCEEPGHQPWQAIRLSDLFLETSPQP